MSVEKSKFITLFSLWDFTKLSVLGVFLFSNMSFCATHNLILFSSDATESPTICATPRVAAEYDYDYGRHIKPYNFI